VPGTAWAEAPNPEVAGIRRVFPKLMEPAKIAPGFFGPFPVSLFRAQAEIHGDGRLDLHGFAI
jgi:hypothetical protein